MGLRRLTFFLLIGCYLVTGQNNIEKGVVVDSIAVLNSQEETFAVYLPKSFDPEKANPILFVFEPAARGKVGIAPFIESAEKYGLILVCSNNSRNGSYEKSFAVAQNLFSHVLSTYKVDSAKMFLSGFSGGSRLAAAIATLTNQFAGVIGCGAGFSGNPSHTPSLEKFLYVGICGNEDMNYSEMLTNKEYLSKLNFTNSLITFNGGHQWPPVPEINQALDWLFLQLNKARTGFASSPELKEGFVQDSERARICWNEGQLLLAVECYERILHSYPKEFGLDSIRAIYGDILRSKQYKKEIGEQGDALDFEKRIRKKLYLRLVSDLKSPEDTNWKWWSKEVKKLDKIKESDTQQMQYAIARIKNALAASVYEARITSPQLIKKGYSSFLKAFWKVLYSNDSE